MTVYDSLKNKPYQFETEFLYIASSIPIVTDIIPEVLSVEGGELVSVTYMDFNSDLSNIQVKVGDKAVVISSNEENEFFFISPSMKPGVYELEVFISDKGKARISSTIEYSLYVTSFTPKIGSIKGMFNYLELIYLEI